MFSNHILVVSGAATDNENGNGENDNIQTRKAPVHVIHYFFKDEI